jgi:hypothetical protein
VTEVRYLILKAFEAPGCYFFLGLRGLGTLQLAVKNRVIIVRPTIQTRVLASVGVVVRCQASRPDKIRTGSMGNNPAKRWLAADRASAGQ